MHYGFLLSEKTKGHGHSRSELKFKCKEARWLDLYSFKKLYAWNGHVCLGRYLSTQTVVIFLGRYAGQGPQFGGTLVASAAICT